MAKRKSTKVPPCRPVKGRPKLTKVRTDNGLSCAERKFCYMASHYLSAGLQWELTAEGEAFWEAVYERLYALSEGAPLK